MCAPAGRVSWRRRSFAPANASDLEVAPEVVAGATGQVLGDRNSWHPLLREQLAGAGIAFVAPYSKRGEDPDPTGSKRVTRRALAHRDGGRPVRRALPPQAPLGRDAWHLTSRTLRKVLSHTIAVFLCLERGHPLCSSPSSWPREKPQVPGPSEPGEGNGGALAWRGRILQARESQRIVSAAGMRRQIPGLRGRAIGETRAQLAL